MKTDCVELNELVSAYADGELDAAERSRVEEHIASCRECSDFVQTCRRIDQAVEKELAPPVVESPRWDAMFSQLTAATADRAGKRRWRFKPIRVIAFASSMAAACLLGLALVMTPRQPDPKPDPVISLAGDASDYEVVMVAAPEGGLSMMVIIDTDDEEKDLEDVENGSKPGETPATKPEAGDK
jgi:anti-sigma factor RsiW